MEVEKTMTISELQRLRYALSNLKSLQEGWLNGEGAVIEVTEWVEDVLTIIIEGCPDLEACIGPTVEGLVEAEWDVGTWTVSLELPVDENGVKVWALSKHEDQEFLVSGDASSVALVVVRLLKGLSSD